MMLTWLSTMSDAAAVVSTETASASSLVDLPLMSKGLITTVVGLLGVFLVLSLFFVTIKIMQRIKTKDSEE